MYQIVEFFNNNPRATAADAVDYFGKEFEIPKQVQYLKTEGARISEIRAQLRPAYGERRDVEERSKGAISDIEVEIMLTYPPRQGNDADREALRRKLKVESEQYQAFDKKYQELSNRIFELEHELDEVDRNAKNARRLTELYEALIQFIMVYRQESKTAF